MNECPAEEAPTPGEYASPPCYAHEFPGYFGETAGQAAEIAARLNALLDAERLCAERMAALLAELPAESTLLAPIRRLYGTQLALVDACERLRAAAPAGDGPPR